MSKRNQGGGFSTTPQGDSNPNYNFVQVKCQKRTGKSGNSRSVTAHETHRTATSSTQQPDRQPLSDNRTFNIPLFPDVGNLQGQQEPLQAPVRSHIAPLIIADQHQVPRTSASLVFKQG